jgi:hypothetical protein
MKTSFKLVAALVLSAALTGHALADDKGKEKPNVSKAAAKPLKAAKDDLDAKKFQEALGKLKEVQALPNKTPYDEFVLDEMLGFASLKTGDDAGAAKAYEALLQSQYLEDSERPRYVKTVAQLNYQLKDYDKAIDYGQRAVKGGFADETIYTLVSQAYYLKGDYKGALKFTDNYTDTLIKKGDTPKETQLNLILSSCVKLDDQACTTHALEKMVTYYPKQEYWQNLLYSMFTNKDNSDRTLLDVYRLATEVDALKRPEDYTEMAQLAIEQGSPGEAQRVLEKGFAKNVFVEQRDKDRNQRLLDSAKKQAAADQAQLAHLETEAEAAKTGDKDVALGIAYLGYQQYSKAVDALNRGLQKGSLKNETQARLLLGIAQLKAGSKDDATKTFHAVKGDPTLERLANLWTLHAHQA